MPGFWAGVALIPHLPHARRARTRASAFLLGSVKINPDLLDDLVGNRHQRRWNRHTERACRLEIDDELKLRRLHDRQIGGLFAPENAAHIDAALAVTVVEARSVAHQTTGGDELALEMHHGHAVCG